MCYGDERVTVGCVLFVNDAHTLTQHCVGPVDLLAILILTYLLYTYSILTLYLLYTYSLLTLYLLTCHRMIDHE